MASLSFYLRFSPILRVFKGRSSLNQCKVGNFKQISYFTNEIFENQNSSPYRSTFRGMAGHAKWQNIKHIKAEKDKQKSLLCNKYVRMVTAAVREKGPDPKANNKLAQLLEEAKKNNIPASTLESALKRSSSKKLQTGSIEMLAPGGCMVIFEYETDNLCEMRRMIKSICRKYGAGIYPSSGERWRSVYEQKGIVRVIKQLSGESLDNEKMLDAAIEAGAEDVQKIEDENYYEFYCAPEDVHNVKSQLEKDFVVDEFFVAYLPTATVSPSDDDKTLALSFINELAELPDVTRLFENLE